MTSFVRHALGYRGVLALLAAAAVGPFAFVLSLRSELAFRTLPYPQAHRLVRTYESSRETGQSSLSPATCAAAMRLATYMRVACFTQSGGEGLMGSGPEAWPALRTTVSPGFFDVMGVKPQIGTAFSSLDADGAVLSFDVWRDRFSEDPAIVGKQVVFVGKPRTVIGVMPADFNYPAGTTLWTQESFDREVGARERGTRYWEAIGRLEDTRSLMEARAQLEVIHSGLRTSYPGSHGGWTPLIIPMEEAESRNAATMIDRLISLGLMVFFVGCLNVAALAMARSFRYLAPGAVRIALGANRARLVWDTFKPDAVCLVAGGFLGWILSALILFPGLSSIDRNFAADGAASWGALTAFLLSGLLVTFGLLPSSSRLALIDEARLLKEGVGAATRRNRRYRWLLASESCVVVLAVLFGAAVLLDLRHLQQSEEGIARNGLFVAETVRNGLGWLPVPAILDQLPGAATARPFLLDGVERPGVVFRKPEESSETRHPAMLSFVSPNFFDILGTRLKEGAAFDWATDRKPRTAIVSESLARILSQSGQAALSQHIVIEVPPWEVEIVGVAPDLPGSIRAATPPMVIYLPASTEDQISTLVLRPRTGVVPDWATTKETLRTLEPRLTLTKLNPMNALLQERLQQPRLLMGLGCIVASTLLALVIVGTWALARMELWERERELGIRMAVGCPPTQAVRIILLGSASWALGGALLGAVLGWPLTRSLGAIPWHIAELPLAFAPAASLVVSGICFLAALGPALGAVTLDARRLLRAE